MQEVGAEKGCGKRAPKNFPPPATEFFFNYEWRWLGMMMKMKKMNVLIYQVTRFSRDNSKNIKEIVIVASEASDLIN